MFDNSAQAVDAAAEIDRIAMQVHRERGIQREHGSAASVWISNAQSVVLGALQCSTTPLGNSARSVGMLAAICTAANGEHAGDVASWVRRSCWAPLRSALAHRVQASRATIRARAHTPLSPFPALAPLPDALANVLHLPSSLLAPFVEKESSVPDLSQRGKNVVY